MKKRRENLLSCIVFASCLRLGVTCRQSYKPAPDATADDPTSVDEITQITVATHY